MVEGRGALVEAQREFARALRAAADCGVAASAERIIQSPGRERAPRDNSPLVRSMRCLRFADGLVEHAAELGDEAFDRERFLDEAS